MKIYRCDKCGREVIETFGHDVLNEEGWTREWYDENGEPFHFYYDEKSKRYYTDQWAAAVKHFCPTCTPPPII